MLIRWILFPLCLIACSVAQAAINPEEFIRNAPEKIRIKVEASFINSDTALSQITLMARVLEVDISESGLKEGDYILIAYSQNHARYNKKQKAMDKKAKTGWAGPQILYYPPALSTGNEVLAHLERLETTTGSGAIFQPVGHQYAFKMIP